MNKLIEEDKKAREAALDTTKSFIVEAPAGSGKTEILIQRFLSLLTIVNQPEEILAITFTKKAANEMRQRILSALNAAVEEIPVNSAHERRTREIANKVLQRDQHLSWYLLNNPNQLKIQTIDSFCGFLTKQLPILSHLGATTDISTEPNILYEEAALAVIMQVEENHSWSEDIKTLLLYLDNDLDKLKSLLVDMLAKRDQWLALIYYDDVAEIRAKLENNLAKLIEETLQKIIPLFSNDLTYDLITLLNYAALNLKVTNTHASPIITFSEIKTLPDAKASNKMLWHGLSQFLLTKKFEFRKRPDAEIGFPPLNTFTNPLEIKQHKAFREKYKEVVRKIENRDDMRLLLQEIQLLPNPTYDDRQWKILCALMTLLKIVNAQLRLVFQAHGKIDFIENVQAALATLGTQEHPTDLALSLDYQLRHILIDEFQDTSHTQYQLLEKLVAGYEQGDGRTLFVVGDPMQSIYRFRQADVGLFIKMMQFGIGSVTLHPLKLAINFRSSAEIVHCNNAFFSQVFPKYNDCVTGAVAYHPSIAKNEGNITQRDDACEAIGFVNDEMKKEAEAIKDLVLGQLKNNPDDTIAILVKSRSHLNHIIPMLQKNNILFQAIDIDSLASKQHIQDLTALTRAMHNPVDKIAWLSILRAPWCGLTLTELFNLSEHSKGKTLLDAIKTKESLQFINDSSKNNFERFVRIICSQLTLKLRVPLREWIENTWLALGGPACLNNISDIEDTECFFQTLEELELKHEFSIATLNKKTNHLFASTHHSNSRLHIMTIHAAKGLEFDTVIIPQLNRKNPNDDKSLMLWLERPLAHSHRSIFLLASIHEFGQKEDALYRYIDTQNKKKMMLELDRLLYVAASRAKKRLYYTFNVASVEDDFSIPAHTFLSKLWPHFNAHKLISLHTNKEQPSQPESISPLHPIRKIHSKWIHPLTYDIQSLDTLHTKLSGFQFKQTLAQKIGTLTHRLLQQLGTHSIDWWQEKDIHLKTCFIKSQLQQYNVATSDHDIAIKKIITAIDTTVLDTRGKWILHSHLEACSEFRISFVHNQKVENIIIDRTFIDEHNARWIIDYKTSVETDDLQEFLEQQQKIYHKKMSLYHDAFKLFEQRTIKLGLYFPLVPAWQEWS